MCFFHDIVYSWDHDQDALLKASERQASTYTKQLRPRLPLSAGVTLSILHPLGDHKANTGTW